MLCGLKPGGTDFLPRQPPSVDKRRIRAIRPDDERPAIGHDQRRLNAQIRPAQASRLFSSRGAHCVAVRVQPLGAYGSRLKIDVPRALERAHVHRVDHSLRTLSDGRLDPLAGTVYE